MDRPQLFVPTEDIKLLSLKKPVTIRPYLVGEEKILLMARQAQEHDKNTKEVVKAIKQIVHQCSNGVIDVAKLPTFDLLYLFLRLRAISLNNVIETNWRCKKMNAEGQTCNTIVGVSIKIDDVQLVTPKDHTNRVILSDTLGCTLRYPVSEDYELAVESGDMATLIASCLETIYETHVNGKVWEVRDWGEDEVQNFVFRLTLANMATIRARFFDTMPHVEYAFTFACPQCGHTEPIVLTELDDFFG